MGRLRLPKGPYSAVLVALLAVVIVLLGVMLIRPMTTTIRCDGAYPRWMLEATDYDGGGCVEVLPSHAAPPNADWTLYCTGMCDCDRGGDIFHGACRLDGA